MHNPKYCQLLGSRFSNLTFTAYLGGSLSMFLWGQASTTPKNLVKMPGNVVNITPVSIEIRISAGKIMMLM